MTNTNIATLEQAGRHLVESGVVDYTDMTVEGKQLLEVCGYRTDSAIKQTIERQIDKHKLIEGSDFRRSIDAFSESRKKPMVYRFSMNAANHVLLAAMTEKGKAARQDAIDTKIKVQQLITIPDFNNPVEVVKSLTEAANAWAEEYEQKQLALKQIELQAPKVTFFDQVVEKDGLITATQVAQKHKKSAVWLNKVLIEHNVYNRSIKRAKVFQQWFIDKEYGEMKQTSEGYDQALFTNLGETWVNKLLNDEGLIEL